MGSNYFEYALAWSVIYLPQTFYARFYVWYVIVAMQIVNPKGFCADKVTELHSQLLLLLSTIHSGYGATKNWFTCFSVPMMNHYVWPETSI